MGWFIKQMLSKSTFWLVFSANIVFASLPLSLWRLVPVTFEDVWISFKALYTTPYHNVQFMNNCQNRTLARYPPNKRCFFSHYISHHVAIKYNFDTNLWLGYFLLFLWQSPVGIATRLKTKCQMPVKYPRGGGECMEGLGEPFKLMSSGKQQNGSVYWDYIFILTKQTWMATTIWCTSLNLYFTTHLVLGDMLQCFRLLLSNCLNWKINCDDHSSLSSTTAVHIYELFHINIVHTPHGKIWTQLIDLAPDVWLHSSVGRASHRYRGGPVEALISFHIA